MKQNPLEVGLSVLKIHSELGNGSDGGESHRGYSEFYFYFLVASTSKKVLVFQIMMNAFHFHSFQ